MSATALTIPADRSREGKVKRVYHELSKAVYNDYIESMKIYGTDRSDF
jgi:hypothetical protein